MTRHARSLIRRRSRIAILIFALTALTAAYALPRRTTQTHYPDALPIAQIPANKPLTIDDYTNWRTITGSTIPPRRVELRNLATGTVQSWQKIDVGHIRGVIPLATDWSRSSYSVLNAVTGSVRAARRAGR